MIWITASEIDNWTIKEPRKAQETLPLLIGKLVLASGNDINDYHFPYGNAVQYSGYDGILDTNEKSKHFPDGKSVWEMGTDKNILGKFNQDYHKRTESPNGIVQAETTFCFVTSRIWNHKKGIAEISEERNQDGIWKRVRIIDANDLEQWLDDCPSVQMWFSVIIGKPKTGIQDVYSYWESIVKSTNPQLNTEFFLYNRKSVTKKIVDTLDSEGNQIIVISGSWLESVLCIVAEVVSSGDREIKAFGERCLIVSSVDAMQEVDLNCQGGIIIPCFNYTNPITTGYKNTIIIPANQYDPVDLLNAGDNRIDIQNRTRTEFCEALKKIGFSDTDSYKLGQNLRCNFMALYRSICTDALKKIPNWSKEADVSILIPALFAGAWQGRFQGDIEIISKLSETSYDDYVASISKYTQGENATVSLIEKTYSCISLEEMWDLLFNNITEHKFSIFKECFVEVFSEIDPTYDLPEDKWFMAGVLGKSPIYSDELKNGMIKSLIMMVLRKDADKYRQFTSNIESECNVLVKNVFDKISSLQQWQTICPNLPLLIEATPDTVLKVLENEASSPEGSDFWKLFKGTDDFLFGRTFYTYILWALETCMWDKNYATRALKLLVAYSEKDYSYKLSNCPVDSLYRIFCTWMPQGIFSLDQRKTLLCSIVKEHHGVAPKLFQKLLSCGSQTSSGIAKPKWKPIDNQVDELSKSQVIDMRKYLFECYMDNITPCYNDWHLIFSELSGFDQITEICEKCSAQKNSFSDEDRLNLCKDLYKYISHKRKFNADTPDRINTIEKLYNELLPNTPKYYADYFSYNCYGLNPIPFNPENHSHTEDLDNLYHFQKDKICEMIDSFGSDSVIEIIPLIENVNAYANVITEIVLNYKADWEYVFNIKTISDVIASSIVCALYKNSATDLLNNAKTVLSGEKLGWVLCCLPIDKSITKIVNKSDSEECKKTYWENVKVFGIEDRDTRWINDVIYALLEYQRPYSVIDRFAYGDWNDPKIIIDVLKAALSQQPAPEPTGLTLQNVGIYDIEEMFKKLYKNASGLELEIAQLELSYIKAFDPKFEPKCLINLILDDSVIYFELLTGAFLSDDDIGKSKSENKKTFAELAYTAINRVNRIPGYSVDNKTIDEEKFNNWIQETSRMAKEYKYTEAHNVVLGKILSYSPEGTDGIWPAECVRTVFENPHSETLDSSFITERKNQRGVYTATAGKEEEKIAEHYKEQADKLQLLYPQTASLLLKIGNFYKDQAEHERANELKGL